MNTVANDVRIPTNLILKPVPISKLTSVSRSCTIDDIIKIVNTRDIAAMSRALDADIDKIRYVRDENWTSEIVDYLIDHRFQNFQMIPRRFRTIDVCLEIFEYDASIIGLIPEEYLTEELIINAIERDISAFYLVPKHLRTYNVFLAAIVQDSPIKITIPKEYMTKDVIEHILNDVASVSSILYNLMSIPEEFRDDRFYVKAVNYKRIAYDDVPSEFKTRYFYEELIKYDVSAIERVPVDVIDEELICKIKNNHHNFGSVDLDKVFDISVIPHHLRTEELYENFIRCGGYLEDIPKEDITDNIVIIAIRCNKERSVTIDSLMDEYGNNDNIICAYMVTNRYTSPSIITTKRRCDLYVNIDPLNINVIDSAFIDDSTYINIVLSNHNFISSVPEDRLTEKMCLMSVRINGENLIRIPEKFRTKDVCLAAVYQDMSVFHAIPKELVADIKKDLADFYLIV